MYRRTLLWWVLAGVVLLALPNRCPAPLVYRPGEGWTYEPVEGGSAWKRARAKDQLDVAKAAFDLQDYSLALKSARYLVRTWPFSDYAPEAQYLVGRCQEVRKQDEKAFKEYGKLLRSYPNTTNVNDVLDRQYEIAGRFLAGQWFKLWGFIPAFKSMEKTAGLYQEIVNFGPYSTVGPESQMNIGAAREKQKRWEEAAHAYEIAVYRYLDRPKIAADALFRAGQAWEKQALEAEYDQSAAGRSITSFTDFAALFPADPRVKESREAILAMRAEQARGSFEIARYYEKLRKPQAALIYYSEVSRLHPDSPLADEARQRLDALRQKLGLPTLPTLAVPTNAPAIR
jgi:outer membrane protein assembly factor BamD (BamD/ComL family)